MANFLFWNLGKQPLKDQVALLSREREVDVLILAESEIPDVELLTALNQESESKFRTTFSVSPRIRCYFRYPRDSIRPVLDEGGVSAISLSPPIGVNILIVAVHLPSKLHRKDIDLAFHSTRVADTIREAETAIGHKRTVVVGDFNMNPFESGVVSADGLHAVMDRQIASRKGRKVQGKYRDYFYNPMWRLMGDDLKGPPGSYYYADTNYVSYFWNTFDQVMLRCDLVEFFSNENLEIISSISTDSLLNERGFPDTKSYSDHLPLGFTINIERSVH